MFTRPIALAFGAAVVAGALVLPSPARSQPRASGPTGSISGEVAVYKDGKRKSNHSKVVVYLGEAPRAARRDRRHVITQKNQQFAPRVNVVVKGTVVDFPNQDKIFHNVFSTSRAARFDLGLYRSGSSKSVKFRRPGVVDIFCNIHPNMVSRVLVLETDLYDMTDSAGRFRIDGVPPGTYPVIAWQAYGKPARGQVIVRAGQVSTLELKLEEGKKPKQHRRKDGTPYGRYE